MRARGVAGLTRLPVTEEIAGSNPVGPAKVLMFFWFCESVDLATLQVQLPSQHRLQC